MERSSNIWTLSAALLAGSIAATGMAAAQEWKPRANVELVVPNAPGGGNDAIARLVQKVFQDGKIVQPSSSVVNKPGGGGNVALGYLMTKPGDAHYLGIASITLQLNHITGLSPHRYSDFTPLAVLIGDYIAFAVRADSEIKTAKDLIERLKKSAGSVSTAVTSTGGANHIPIVLVAKAVGANAKALKTPVFNSTGESITAMLGGHVDLVLGSAGILAPHVEAGRARVIAVSSVQRVAGAMAQVPTWKELGVDIEFSNWRGIVGPKGMTSAQLAYWDSAFAQAVAAPEWKSALEKSLWANDYMNSKEMRAYLDRTEPPLRGALAEIGLAK